MEKIVLAIGFCLVVAYKILTGWLKKKFHVILRFNGILLYFICNFLSVFIMYFMRRICMEYHLYGKKYCIVYMPIYAICLLLNMVSLFKLEDYLEKHKRNKDGWSYIYRIYLLVCPFYLIFSVVVADLICGTNSFVP